MRYLKSFEYHTPETTARAGELLLEHGPEARLLAGGTDLLVRMKAGVIRPGHLISLKALARGGLAKIEENRDGRISLGSLTTLRNVLDSPVLQSRAPVLSRTAALMASPQVRNLATVGGNLANAAPSADLAPPLIALGAKVILDGPQGERSLPLEEFFTGPGQTCLDRGELLVRIEIPSQDDSVRAVYRKFMPRQALSLALVGVAVRLRVEQGRFLEPRVVLGAVAPTPLRAIKAEAILDGQEPELEVVRAAAQAAAEESRPISDVRASADYRRALVAALVEQAVSSLI